MISARFLKERVKSLNRMLIFCNVVNILEKYLLQLCHQGPRAKLGNTA